MIKFVLCLALVATVLAADTPTAIPISVNIVGAATLNGASEVPPTTSKSTGVFSLMPGAADSLTFELAVMDIAAVTASHIHAGAAGVSGPVVAVLLNASAPESAASTPLVVQGELMPSNFTGALSMMTINQIQSAITNGSFYVNVHTVANPAGEIRGQIMTPGAGPSTGPGMMSPGMMSPGGKYSPAPPSAATSTMAAAASLPLMIMGAVLATVV